MANITQYGRTAANLVVTAVRNGLMLATDKVKLDGLYRSLPAVRAETGANVSVPSGVVSIISFPAHRYDTHGFHSTTVNPSRLTVPAGLGGLYLITFAAVFDSIGSDGRRAVAILVNGATVLAAAEQGPVPGAFPSFAISTVFLLAETQYIEGYGYQNSGVPINLLTGAAYSVVLSLTRLGG